MKRSTDIRVTGVAVFLLDVKTRLPLKFGNQIVDSVTVARVAVAVETAAGRRAIGWGETPLAVQWGWPSSSPLAPRLAAMVQLTLNCSRSLLDSGLSGHALEIGLAFRREALSALAGGIAVPNQPESLPELASLICLSPLDVALHDAFGVANDIDTYHSYTADFLTCDLADLFAEPAQMASFRGLYPSDFLEFPAPRQLRAWHLVGGLDPLTSADAPEDLPADGHPVLLADWIARDGLDALKVKLRGDDLEWDIDRLLRVAAIGHVRGVRHYCADFNCTVTDVGYVHAALDAIASRDPLLAGQLSYVEQPFPYDLTANPIDVSSLSSRTRLLLDESCHDWTFVKRGHELGWNGVALKTCKTQSGALLSLCWAKHHGLHVMVQDLTNPMLAMIPHARLAAHAGTFAGVETNACQFYPEASSWEARLHPGLYRRRAGYIELTSLTGPGFGQRVAEISRPLPEPTLVVGTIDQRDWRLSAQW
ncbi:MAG: mandelate racemase/muconate lactonizing enzyme family protein [Planctomycetota bacterium]|nr:mandelate racemase/muconate lactonizing enzyme family protein [Planctomycetota bacterium]